MKSPSASQAKRELASAMVGVWWLLSREDRTADGSLRVDPALGSDPLGILTYAPTRFAAQFMKRDRSAGNVPAFATGQNNTGAVDGYDAYFGTYEVDPECGEVVHVLQGALSPDNVGIRVSRRLEVDGNRLRIQLDTTTVEGEPVTRTLTWQRIG